MQGDSKTERSPSHSNVACCLCSELATKNLQDSNTQSSDQKSDALYIRPRGTRCCSYTRMRGMRRTASHGMREGGCNYAEMSTPGVEPGLSRPQRDVLTTRRCGLLHVAHLCDSAFDWAGHSINERLARMSPVSSIGVAPVCGSWCAMSICVTVVFKTRCRQMAMSTYCNQASAVLACRLPSRPDGQHPGNRIQRSRCKFARGLLVHWPRAIP